MINSVVNFTSFYNSLYFRRTTLIFLGFKEFFTLANENFIWIDQRAELPNIRPMDLCSSGCQSAHLLLLLSKQQQQ